MKNKPSEKSEMSNAYLQKYEGVKVLVLGATGFIGRWVARNLCAANATVFLTARDKMTARKIFADYSIEGEVYEQDLLDEIGVHKMIRQIRPAIIFNLAGYGIDRTETSEVLAYRINAQLLETLCAAAAAARDSGWEGQNIVHVGTAMEYGSVSGDLAESSEPHPTTLYGKSKLAGTQILTQCCQKYRLKGLTARLFAVYGAGEASVRLLPTLIEASRTRETIELTAGLHERDFIYVEDAAEGLLRLGLSLAKAGEIVNLATGVLSSIRHFTETAAGEMGIPDERLKFGAIPTRPEEMKHKPVTIARLHKLTGWSPPTTIVEGVRKTMSFSQRFAFETFG